MITRFSCAHTAAVALALGGLVVSALAGERVTFSKPDQEMVAPKESDPVRLRSAPNEVRRGSPTPAMDLPYIAPPVRIDPRKTDRKNIFGDPKNPFAEPSDDDSEKEGNSSWNRHSSEKKPFSVPFADPSRSAEQERALSPIQRFDWYPDDGEKAQKEQASRQQQSYWSRTDRDTVEPGVFGSFGVQREMLRDFGNTRAFGLFQNENSTRELNREPTHQEVERRNEFQKLLNPSFSPLARNGMADALASPMDATRGSAPILPATPALSPQSRSLDPMRAFKDQQQTWRGPSIEELNRRSFGAVSTPQEAVPKPSVTTAPKVPLMRQPTILEIPARAF